MLYHLLYPLHEFIFLLQCLPVYHFQDHLFDFNCSSHQFYHRSLVDQKVEDLSDSTGGERGRSRPTHGKEWNSTMGGSLILGGVLIPTLFWSDLTNPYVWIVLLTTLAFGILGFFR